MAENVEQKELVKGFVLSFVVSSGDTISLEFTSSHNAEQVLRGLVHSGYGVTISEQLVTMPDKLKAFEDWERNRYIGNGDFDRNEPQTPTVAGMTLRHR